MAKHVNKVILIGNLGNDPELRTFPNTGTPVCNVSLYTDHKWRDSKTGELRTETERHRLVVMGRLAEVLKEYARKGAPLYVEGRLRTRKWIDEDTRLERETREIVVNDFSLLGFGRKDTNGVTGPQAETAADEANTPAADAGKDPDIPF